ncbi:hypothetical protein GCM10027285_04110 [Oleiagrimonas citrea]|uniref:Uncharacterized protein n=1 Tax=Oleiagrimonas citrea TaxID=1665687 RepID=A0A846ZPE5_9GAMM|nr:hypothetical protein [Oleiagrimonas citrea]NKZ39450.1 hypothetical protein [Oleiagrimonas citrea]
MTEAAPIARLRRWRARLLKVYVFHVGWLTSTCAFAATGATHATVATTLWLTLVTIPPVLIYTVIVHRACRAVDPSARSGGRRTRDLHVALPDAVGVGSGAAGEESSGRDTPAAASWHFIRRAPGAPAPRGQFGCRAAGYLHPGDV